MKKGSLALAVCAVFLLSGCHFDPLVLLEPAPGTTAQVSESPSPSSEKILNLPEELYVECPEYDSRNEGLSALRLSYAFAVTVPMELTLTVEQKNGTISLGIQPESGNDYVYEKREFTSESDTVRLEPDSYRLVVSAKNFQGSYAVSGVAAE